MKISSGILIGLLTLPGLCWFGWTSFSAASRMTESTEQARQSTEFLTVISQAYTSIREIESGMQEFNANGDSASVTYIRSTISRLASQLETARLLTADDLIQHRNTTRLILLTEQKTALQIAAIKSRQNLAGYTMAQNKAQSGTNSINQVIFAMKKQEQQLARNTAMAIETAAKRDLFTTKLVISGYLILLAVISLIAYKRRRKSIVSLPSTGNVKYQVLQHDPLSAVFTTDISGRFIFVSDQVKPITGFDPQELVNKDISLLVTPAFAILVSEHFKRQYLARRPESTIYFPIFTKSGEHKWVEQLSVLKHEKGKVTGFQGILKDIGSDNQEPDKSDIKSTGRRRYIATQASNPESQWGVSKGSWRLP